MCAELFAQYLSFLSLLKFDMLLTIIVLLMLNAENITHSAAYIVGIVMVIATACWYAPVLHVSAFVSASVCTV